MKNFGLSVTSAILLLLVFSIPASAMVNSESMDSGSVYYGDSAALEGAPFYPSSLARLDLGAIRNGIVYTGTEITMHFFAPANMYVNILDFAPDGYSYLLRHNYFTAPGSNTLDWVVTGTVEGSAGKEYLYLVVSTQALDFDYLNNLAENPKTFEAEDFIYATDIESFQVFESTSPGTSVGTYGGVQTYNPFVQIYGTPLEVYPTYYIFPGNPGYYDPYYYYYYFLPDYTHGGGKMYRTRVGINGRYFYAYPQGGNTIHNLKDFSTTGRIIGGKYTIIPGGYIRGGFNLGIVSSPLGLVIHPNVPAGFYRSFKDWGNDFTFEVVINGQDKGYGYVVNQENGAPLIYVPMAQDALVEGMNDFEIKVPDTGQTMQIDRIEVVETGMPEEVDEAGTAPEVQNNMVPQH